jgi:hypothetical protein
MKNDGFTLDGERGKDVARRQEDTGNTGPGVRAGEYRDSTEIWQATKRQLRCALEAAFELPAELEGLVARWHDLADEARGAVLAAADGTDV